MLASVSLLHHPPPPPTYAAWVGACPSALVNPQGCHSAPQAVCPRASPGQPECEGAAAAVHLGSPRGHLGQLAPQGIPGIPQAAPAPVACAPAWHARRARRLRLHMGGGRAVLSHS